jgi:hypothetical protein
MQRAGFGELMPKGRREEEGPWAPPGSRDQLQSQLIAAFNAIAHVEVHRIVDVTSGAIWLLEGVDQETIARWCDQVARR